MTNAPRLYLATPPVADPAVFLPQLGEALAAAPFSSLLLRFATAEPTRMLEIAKKFLSPTQTRGVALVLDSDPQTALYAGADGAQIAGFGPALREAIKTLSPRYIVGAGALETRDDSMSAGEAGADYLLFGDLFVDGAPPPAAATLERVAWWAELFTTPCVALAHHLDDIGPLCEAGADFIMLGDLVWSDARGPAAAIADAVSRLKDLPA